MIVLDTNVVSAVMRRAPDMTVAGWLDRQPTESLWLTVVSVFEIRFGIDLLPASRRRRELVDAFDRALVERFEGRILAFDEPAAAAAAAIAARRRKAGRTVEFRDTQIAGIVAARRAVLATGNVRHFDGLGIEIVDPWTGR